MAPADMAVQLEADVLVFDTTVPMPMSIGYLLGERVKGCNSSSCRRAPRIGSIGNPVRLVSLMEHGGLQVPYCMMAEIFHPALEEAAPPAQHTHAQS